MMQKNGQKKSGVNMTDMFKDIANILYENLDKTPVDHLISYYKNDPFNKRDKICCDLIWDNFDKQISDILIIGGNIPLVYLEKFKNYNLTFVDNNSCLSYCANYIKEKFNCKVVKTNPVTTDISNLIENNQLIIYPETETLVPFELLRYNHNKKIIFCSNFLYYDFKINNNLAYSEEDLIDICKVENVKISGSIPLKFYNTKRNFYYVMGNGR